jgi:hypothetical protein
MHILLDNPTDETQYGWFFCGLPKETLRALAPQGYMTDGTTQYPFVVEEGGIRVYALILAQHKLKLEFDTIPRKPKPFQWHPKLEGMQCFDVLPKFYIEGVAPTRSFLTNVYTSEASTVWHSRCHWDHEKVTVDAWFTAYSDVDYVDFAVQCVYGTTEPQQPQTRSLGSLYMVSKHAIFADFQNRNGHGMCSLMADGRFSMTVVKPQRWHRASRYPMRGSLCPGGEPPSSRSNGVQIFGLWSGWDGNWGPIGKVPVATSGLTSIRNYQMLQYLSDTNDASTGQLDAPRPRVQERSSGTTGEQHDFGVASDLAVTAGQSWEIHDALWQCQGYELRPTANKDGHEPMLASRHPNAQTYNQRPDLSYGSSDRLGWPGVNQIEWMPSPTTTQWTTSDDQHRSDLFLHATYLLTRDHALRAVIEDHIELDLTDVVLNARMRTSPRAVGRLAITRAWQYWLGFEKALDALHIGLDTAYITSTMAQQPATKAVLILAGNEQAKYGWIHTQNQSAIIGWQPWQETIAAIGFYTAARALQNSDVPWAKQRSNDLLNIANTLAHVVTENAWRITKDSIAHAYALRWNDGDMFPDASWPTLNPYGDSSTNDIYVSTACSYWTAAAAHIIKDSEIGAKFLARFPAPRSIAEARWRAL